jgi:hypothetical protein
MNPPEKLPDEEPKTNRVESLTFSEIVCSGSLGLLGYFMADANFASGAFPLKTIGLLVSTMLGSLVGYLIAYLWKRNFRQPK